jgi:hypothetical protein
MPLNIKGKNYPMPKEGNQPGPTGREMIEIENYFGLDALVLLSSLSTDAKPIQGYSKTKAFYALAWIAMTRGGEVVSIEDLLNDLAIDDIVFEEDDSPKEVIAD